MMVNCEHCNSRATEKCEVCNRFACRRHSDIKQCKGGCGIDICASCASYGYCDSYEDDLERCDHSNSVTDSNGMDDCPDCGMTFQRGDGHDWGAEGWGN